MVLYPSAVSRQVKFVDFKESRTMRNSQGVKEPLSSLLYNHLMNKVDILTPYHDQKVILTSLLNRSIMYCTGYLKKVHSISFRSTSTDAAVPIKDSFDERIAYSLVRYLWNFANSAGLLHGRRKMLAVCDDLSMHLNSKSLLQA